LILYLEYIENAIILLAKYFIPKCKQYSNVILFFIILELLNYDTKTINTKINV